VKSNYINNRGISALSSIEDSVKAAHAFLKIDIPNAFNRHMPATPDTNLRHKLVRSPFHRGLRVFATDGSIQF